jgi:hypothetical protein
VRRSPSPDDGRVALVERWSETDERTLARLLGRLVDDLEATPVPPISQKSKTGEGP